METYKNLGENSSVVAYESGSDYIKVKFNDSSMYLYNYQSTGVQNIETMKNLAEAGRGLSSFINTNVRKNYASKLQ
jgi:hypothetical protein